MGSVDVAKFGAKFIDHWADKPITQVIIVAKGRLYY
jgi:hypothetical protein